MGNGNILTAEMSRLRMQVTGNGNQISLVMSRVEMVVSGNANEVRSEAEIEPLVVNDCRGFGNSFPQNVVNREIGQMSNNNYNSGWR